MNDSLHSLFSLATAACQSSGSSLPNLRKLETMMAPLPPPPPPPRPPSSVRPRSDSDSDLVTSKQSIPKADMITRTSSRDTIESDTMNDVPMLETPSGALPVTTSSSSSSSSGCATSCSGKRTKSKTAPSSADNPKASKVKKTSSGDYTADPQTIRRQKHNEVEVRRRRRMNETFAQLRTLLDCRSANKISILAAAVERLEYFMNLQSKGQLSSSSCIVSCTPVPQDKAPKSAPSTPIADSHSRLPAVPSSIATVPPSPSVASTPTPTLSSKTASQTKRVISDSSVSTHSSQSAAASTSASLSFHAPSQSMDAPSSSSSEFASTGLVSSVSPSAAAHLSQFLRFHHPYSPFLPGLLASQHSALPSAASFPPFFSPFPVHDASSQPAAALSSVSASNPVPSTIASSLPSSSSVDTTSSMASTPMAIAPVASSLVSASATLPASSSSSYSIALPSLASIRLPSAPSASDATSASSSLSASSSSSCSATQEPVSAETSRLCTANCAPTEITTIIPANSTCALCFTRPRSVVHFPCGHARYCSVCASSLGHSLKGCAECLGPSTSLLHLQGRVCAPCVLCEESPVDVAFQPCGHFIYCSRCTTRTKRCPQCLALIEGRVFVRCAPSASLEKPQPCSPSAPCASQTSQPDA